MRSTSWILSLVVPLGMAACVSLDSRAWNEEVDREATAEFGATFLNRAVYRSKGEFLASPSLAEALRVPAASADKVFVAFSKNGGLSLQFSKEDRVLLTKAYTVHEGLRITDKGSIVIPTKVECGGGDSPGFGCGSRVVTLYLNSRRELVCVESGAAAGVIGVIPMGHYVKLVSMYMQPTGNRDVDNIPNVK